MEEVFHVSPGLSEFYREAQNRLLAVAGWEFYHVVDSKLGTQLPISLKSLRSTLSRVDPGRPASGWNRHSLSAEASVETGL